MSGRQRLGAPVLTFEDYLARVSHPDNVHHLKEEIADNIADNYHGMSHPPGMTSTP